MKRERKFSLLNLFDQYLPLATGPRWQRQCTLIRVKRAVILHAMEPSAVHELLIREMSQFAIAAGWTRVDILAANREALETRRAHFGAAIVKLSTRKVVKLDFGAESVPSLTKSQKRA
jgi:hypothetical protein